jgi:NAD(P)-dependent dehydrogenase (short-subunit alcohol dehydrogenase family)
MTQAGPSLTGKVALVTGASRGIGRAIAQRLASAGATVVITARSMDSAATSIRANVKKVIPGTLTETVALIEAAGGNVFAIAADLENPAERDGLVDKAVALAGGIDILVNNAGYADYGRMETMSLETFDRTVDHYFRVPFVLSKAAIPHMKAKGAGWIVNVGSTTALAPQKPYRPHQKAGGELIYASCKAALNRFTQGLAAELLDYNIAVNVIGPSTAIRTPGASDLIPEGYDTEDPAYLAEAALALSYLPAAERSGLVTYSMHYPHHLNIQVKSLDGKSDLSHKTPPDWAHPLINATGEWP